MKENFEIQVVETSQPVDGLTVTTYTDNTTKIEVSEDLKKQMIDFMAYYNKEVEKCGFVEYIAKKINCDFFSKHPITDRGTGHVKIGGRYLDKEQLKKLFGYETTKEPADTKETDGNTKPKTPGKKHVTRVTKLIRARADFMNRCKEIVFNTSIDSCQNLNAFFLDCFKAAKKRDDADKRASDWVYQNSARAKAKAKKVDNAQKAINELSDKQKDEFMAKQMGLSVEQYLILKPQIEAMKQTK